MDGRADITMRSRVDDIDGKKVTYTLFPCDSERMRIGSASVRILTFFKCLTVVRYVSCGERSSRTVLVLFFVDEMEVFEACVSGGDCDADKFSNRDIKSE